MRLADALAGRDLTNKVTVPILLSTEAADRLRQAQDRVDAAEKVVGAMRAAEADLLSKPRTETAERRLEDVQAELAEAEEAARPHLVQFELQSVGSTLWDRLITANRPTDEQIRLYGRIRWNRDTFPLVAVAFSLIDPEVDPNQLDAYRGWLDGRQEDEPPIPQDVVDMKTNVPDVVWQQIWGAALRVNAGENKVPLSLTGSGATRTSETASEPASK